MPRSMKMAEIKRILKLVEENADLSERQLALAVGCSKNTIKVIRTIAKNLNVTYASIKDMNEIQIHDLFYPNNNPYQNIPEPDVEYCVKELKKKHVTVKLLHEEYLEKYPNGLKYTQFRNRILAAESAKSITAHFERKPGERMEIDWSGDRIYYYDRGTGEATPCYVLVCVIGRSGYTYMEAFKDRKSASFLTGVINALSYFGGVPKFLVPDNDKSAVITHKKYEVVCNREFQFLADYYNTIILPARVRKPKDKPLVENAVYNAAERNLIGKMHNKKFYSFTELSDFVSKVLSKFNSGQFSKKEGSRKSVFLGEDKPVLKPLPKTPYELVTIKLAVVNNNYHIEYKGFYYSVPYQYVSKKVELRVSSKIVRIYYENLLIAEHIRLYDSKGRYSTNTSHMPKEHTGMSKEKLISWGRKINSSIGDFLIHYFECIAVEEQGYKGAQGIIDLSRKNLERLIAAIKRASDIECYTYKAVKTIYEKLEDQIKSDDLIENSNLRGPNYYKEIKHNDNWRN